jgi:hypothetical protein
VTHAIQSLDNQRPFQPAILAGVASAVAERAEPVRRELTRREHHQIHRTRFNQATKWWAAIPARNGGQQISHFITEVKEEVGVRDLERATPEQLKRAGAAAMARIQRWCENSGTRLPRWARDGFDDK